MITLCSKPDSIIIHEVNIKYNIMRGKSDISVYKKAYAKNKQ